MKATVGHSHDVMTVEQVADYLQLNKLTVYKYIRNGRLPASKLGKSYRVRKADVDWFLENAKQPARSRAAAAPAPVRRLPIHAGRAIRDASVRPAGDAYVGRPRREDPEAPQSPSLNPMDWVIRGLH